MTEPTTCLVCDDPITRSMVTHSFFVTDDTNRVFFHASREGFIHMHGVTVFQGREGTTVRAAIRRYWKIKWNRTKMVGLRIKGTN